MKRELVDVSTAQIDDSNVTENESLNNNEDGDPSAKKQRVDEKEEEEEEETFKTAVDGDDAPAVEETNAVVAAGCTVPVEETVLPVVRAASPQGAALSVAEATETEADSVVPGGTDDTANAAKSETVDVEANVDQPNDDHPDDEATGLGEVETPEEEPNHVGTPSDKIDEEVVQKEDPALECKVDPVVSDKTEELSEISVDDAIDGPKEQTKEQDKDRMPRKEIKQEDDYQMPQEENEEEDGDQMPEEENEQGDEDEMPREDTKQEDNKVHPKVETMRGEEEKEEGRLSDEAKEEGKKDTDEVPQDGENLDGDDSLKGSKGEKPVNCCGEAMQGQVCPASDCIKTCDRLGSNTNSTLLQGDVLHSLKSLWNCSTPMSIRNQCVGYPTETHLHFIHPSS
jgi:hypothetical protein